MIISSENANAFQSVSDEFLEKMMSFDYRVINVENSVAKNESLRFS